MKGQFFSKLVISHDVMERISRTVDSEEKNEIMHDFLQRACTEEDLMVVCDILVAVRGNPKMRDLGENMKRRLHTGK